MDILSGDFVGRMTAGGFYTSFTGQEPGQKQVREHGAQTSRSRETTEITAETESPQLEPAPEPEAARDIAAALNHPTATSILQLAQFRRVRKQAPPDFSALRESLGMRISPFASSPADLGALMENTLEELSALDPDLAEAVRIFAAFLAGQDPEKAKVFLRSMKHLASRVNASQAQPDFSQVQDASMPTQAESTGRVKIEMRIGVRIRQVEVQVTSGQASENGQADSRLTVDGMVFEKTEAGWAFVQMSDPLVLDLAGNGIDLRSADNGVYFDIDGDGKMEQTAFIQGDDALLFLDQNSNSVADNGHELFGDQGDDANGFVALSRFDTNQDLMIDKQDQVYQHLRLWQDLNGDGIDQENENLTLEQAGVKSLSLRFQDSGRPDSHGNRMAQQGAYQNEQGESRLLADMLFRAYTAR